MAASFIVSLSFFVAQKMGHDAGSTTILLCTVGVTTVVWLTATYVTRPDDEATLAAFYAKVRPAVRAGNASVRLRAYPLPRFAGPVAARLVSGRDGRLCSALRHGVLSLRRRHSGHRMDHGDPCRSGGPRRGRKPPLERF